ncbi:receptor kinase-like protein Xa21 [Zingiber officinale]|uniref:receptor kinase-like protein Xa21 n=1 Tax=Zingiber officinale TaxID=94328 RepID=UPI001C4C11D1|nr:receptor kinase-like protein Xa21 [Zingiber officinale]
MIPFSLFQNCSNLQNFNLSGNSLHGTIPGNLSSCLNLQIIRLDTHMFEGEIPSDVYSLSKLQELNVWNNSLTGRIPPEIGNLSSLTILSLSVNKFRGPIPSEIGNLSSLVELYLSGNQLSGNIPSSIGNLCNLTILNLLSNNLTGTIPLEIGNLVNMQVLMLAGNHLSGIIPNNLGRLKNLDGLILSGNQLEATSIAEWSFIDALSNCTHLRFLQADINNLGGMFPKSIGNLSKNLVVLSFYQNQITGSLPVEIGNLNLSVINMWSNSLSGAIPKELGRMNRLEIINLSSNFLAGEIPTEIGNLSKLFNIVLDTNKLHGPIPLSLGNCPLTILSLAANNLSGSIPKEILYIPSLSIIFNVSNNFLTGTLPLEIGNLRNIKTIDVSNNRLSGGLPSTILGCQLLQYLYMQNNLFQGSIPPSFSELNGLQVLDISCNKLTGRIPLFNTMSFLNLSNNYFEGEVPVSGVFQNFTAFSVSGNSQLCGGLPELSLPSCTPRRKRVTKMLIVVISASGVCFCIMLLICLFAICRPHQKSRGYSEINSHIMKQYRMVTFAELFRATEGFLPANLIGKGSFGSVYKGKLNWENHEEIAVKVLNLQQKGALKSFMSECEALRNIKHRNFIKILTSCSSIDFQENDFKALVFEFLPNGSLENWIYPKANEGTLQRLSLSQRLNIAIDVASALTYLHHHGETPMIHCDLKPSNVLLYHNMVAHVSDFRLSEFLVKTTSSSSMRQTNSSTLKGTIGYVAPEYGMTTKVSAKGDVYSFGILLLEMFTGKGPTSDAFKDAFKEGMNLHKFVEMALPTRITEILDPYLLMEIEEAGGADVSPNESKLRMLECSTSVLRVGILCSKESPKARMHMEDAMNELISIKDAFLRLTV